MLLSLGVSATSEYITSVKAENPPVAMKITWQGESGQAQVFVRPVGEAESNTDDGLYDFHNIDGSMYLPMRKICERLGEVVDWDSALGKAYVVRGENKIDMTGTLINGTTFIKIRDFEKLGYLVDYYVDEDGKPWATLFAREVYDTVNQLHEYDEYINYRENLVNSYKKLTEEKELTVAYLGGSITLGRNYENNCWRTMIDAWLKEQYPEANIKMVRAGIGGTGSSYGAYRVNVDVLAHNPDLIFVEFAANDNHFADKYKNYRLTKDIIKEYYETIIRKIYKHNPEADIVMVYTQTADMIRSTPSIQAHEELAKYYNINSVYFGATLLDYIKENKLTSTDYIYDGLHPTDKGYEILTGPLKELFTNIWSDVDTSKYGEKILPEKMHSAHDRTDSYLIYPKDIEYSSDWTGSGTIKTNIPGASLSCKFSGDEISVYASLSSKGGEIEYRIDGGEWKEKSLRGPVIKEKVQLEANLEYGEHTLEIRCSEKTLPTDTVHIFAILVN